MVNTFLPYSNFQHTARVLDSKRLMKQRVEAYQIIKAIQSRTTSSPSSWIRHPAARQWIGYLPALKWYYNTMIEEAVRRGFTNHMKKYRLPKTIRMPWWMGYRPLHLSHRASLLRKDKSYYKRYFTVPRRYLYYTYVWVSNLSKSVQDGIRQGKVYDISDLAPSLQSMPASRRPKKKMNHAKKKNIK